MVVQLQKGHMYYLQWACIYKYKRASTTMNCVVNADDGNVKKETNSVMPNRWMKGLVRCKN